jgi:hypothetical protein
VALEFAEWMDAQIAEVNKQMGKVNGNKHVSSVDLTRWIVFQPPFEVHCENTGVRTVIYSPPKIVIHIENNPKRGIFDDIL